MPAYSLADPPILAFILLPVAIAILLVWGTAVAWTRTGQPAVATKASLRTAAFTLLWMGATLALAGSGVFRNWNAVPPPFVLLVAAILALGFGMAFSPLGWRLATGL